MPFNINEFRARFLTTGFSHPAHFEVRMQPPNRKPSRSSGQAVGEPGDGTVGQLGTISPSVPLVDGGEGFGKKLSNLKEGVKEFYNGEITLQKLRFLCETVSIPGQAIVPIQYQDYGNPYTMGQSMTQNTDLNVSFIVERGWKVDRMINQWMNMVVDCNPTSKSGEQHPLSSYDVGYYNDYVGTVQVYKYDMQGDIECIYTYQDAYPIQKNQVDLSWASQNEICKLNVGFSYRSWSVEYINAKRSIFGPVNTILATVNTVLGNI